MNTWQTIKHERSWRWTIYLCWEWVKFKARHPFTAGPFYVTPEWVVREALRLFKPTVVGRYAKVSRNANHDPQA